MGTIIAVDRVPISCAGIGALLAGAHEVTARTPSDMAWLDGDPPEGVVIVVREPSTVPLITKIAKAFPDAAILALLADPVTEGYAEVLQAGATGVAALDASADDVLDVLAHAMRGLAVLPTEVVGALATRAGSPPTLDDEQRAWLQQLARGVTIAELSRIAGYSERSMYRLLAAMYTRLGANNRAEAVAAASRRGLV